MAAPTPQETASNAQAAAARFSLHLLSAIRNARVHGTTNQAFMNSIAQLASSAASLQASAGESSEIRFVDEVLLVNGKHVRLNSSASAQVSLLRNLLAARGVGGLAFRAPARPEVLREWVLRLVAGAEGAAPDLASLRDLAGHGLVTLDPRSLAGSMDFEVKKVDRASFAFQAYVRAVVGFSEFVAALKTDRDPFKSRLGIVRVIQDLIDITTEQHGLLLDAMDAGKVHTLELRSQAGGYPVVHAANTSILSLIVGRALGLARLALLDLGTAALFAKAGFALLPESMTEKAGELTAQEKSEVKLATIRAVQALIRHARLGDHMMRRIIVSYEHQRPYYNRATQSIVDTHVYSRIVAVTDAYDAMTSLRPWRNALPVDVALGSLEKDAGTRFDPTVVAVLRAAVSRRL